jgi:hypothetical protein
MTDGFRQFNKLKIDINVAIKHRAERHLETYDIETITIELYNIINSFTNKYEKCVTLQEM